ncbi:MAG TPA: hypothetical protein VFM15_06135, partial [Gammaproteobacteria bacterium]|nr:hypothetical protein [Gammaproteobacteria bacterium]
KCLEVLISSVGGEDAVNMQARTKGFSNEVGAFDADKSPGLAAGMRERAAQLFYARILLTLYNANRHLAICTHLLRDCMP